ncbi:MAG: VWA-like domain-containing protein [Lachnospiraceae bacterium]|nr:VWA-like domain-containing protein [Lachnospiraceae bacterium]
MNVESTIDKKMLVGKLSDARTSLLLKMPFYGTLLMNLRFGLAKCGTASTDMKRILWDPEFLNRLQTTEIEFVMLHEVMHCVLNHVVRGKGKIGILYNIAADIVVNSIILETIGASEFKVDGVEAMHLTPNDEEGRKYSADEVYNQLCNKYKNEIDDVEKLMNSLNKEYGLGIDKHSIWNKTSCLQEMKDEWERNLSEAIKRCSNNSIPAMFREIYEQDVKESSVDWREVLFEFVQVIADSFEYSFTPPDRRFSDENYIFPAFNEMEGEKVENIWTLVDTSGSINEEELATIMVEVKAAIEQFSYFKAKLSCFDTRVTEPIDYENVEDLKKVKLSGGGGTSFKCIFEYMKEHMDGTLPTAIIILTDGYAHFPEEGASLNVPVLWGLINNDTEAPWGKTLHIKTKK